MHGQEPLFSLGFYLHIPKSLWKTAALGPGGRYTGKTYAYYEETARRFLWIYLQTQAAGDCEGQPFVAPEFCIHLEGVCFESEQSEEDLKKLESYLPQLGRWCAWYHGAKASERVADHFCAPESAGLEGARYTYPWKMRSSVGSAVTINLPALAVQAEGDAKELDMLLEQQVHLAFTAFRQHRQFLDGFSESGLETPFPRFDHRSDGEPFFRPGQQRCRVALWGLEEMAAWHSELSFAGKDAGQDLAREFLQQAVQKIELTAQSCRMACEVSLEGDSEVGKILEQRLSGQPRPKSTSRSWNENTDARIFEPSEWVKVLSTPFEEVLTPAELTVQQGESSLAGVLSALNEQGVDYRLVVAQPFWLCQACSRLIPGTPDICPRCGSLQLVSMDL